VSSLCLEKIVEGKHGQTAMSKKNAPYTGGGSGGAAKSQKDAAPARTMSKNDMRLQHMIGNGEPYDAVFAQVQVVCRDDQSCINKQTMNNYGALFMAVNRKKIRRRHPIARLQSRRLPGQIRRNFCNYDLAQWWVWAWRHAMAEGVSRRRRADTTNADSKWLWQCAALH